MQPFGEWVAKNLKYKKVATVGLDYAFGWETVGGFQRTFEEQGGQVDAEDLDAAQHHRLLSVHRPDPAATPTRCSPSSSDGWIAAVREAVRGVGAEGRRSRSSAAGRSPTSRCCRQMGDEALGVHHRRSTTPPALDNPANKKYAKAFEAKAGKIPSYYAETCYTNMRWIVEAIKAINGKVEDREALLGRSARRWSSRTSARGPVVIDKWGNPVQNIYVRKVERVGGQLQNSVIFTYPAVSQFWKYNPDEFLKQPLYTRDYPPCKHC